MSTVCECVLQMLNTSANSAHIRVRLGNRLSCLTSFTDRTFFFDATWQPFEEKKKKNPTGSGSVDVAHCQQVKETWWLLCFHRYILKLLHCLLMAAGLTKNYLNSWSEIMLCLSHTCTVLSGADGAASPVFKGWKPVDVSRSISVCLPPRYWDDGWI